MRSSVSYWIRAMTSEPPKRWGFSKEESATTSPVSRFSSRMTTVVVPRSMARPCSGSVPRSISTPSSKMRSPSRVTAGSSDQERAPVGSSKACFSIFIVPRRMVWQRTVPVSATMRVQHDRRNAPFR